MRTAFAEWKQIWTESENFRFRKKKASDKCNTLRTGLRIANFALDPHFLKFRDDVINFFSPKRAFSWSRVRNRSDTSFYPLIRWDKTAQNGRKQENKNFHFIFYSHSICISSLSCKDLSVSWYIFVHSWRSSAKKNSWLGHWLI